MGPGRLGGDGGALRLNRNRVLVFIERLLCQTRVLSTEDEARSKPARHAVSEGCTGNLQELISL